MQNDSDLQAFKELFNIYETTSTSDKIQLLDEASRCAKRTSNMELHVWVFFRRCAVAISSLLSSRPGTINSPFFKDQQEALTKELLLKTAISERALYTRMLVHHMRASAPDDNNSAVAKILSDQKNESLEKYLLAYIFYTVGEEKQSAKHGSTMDSDTLAEAWGEPKEHEVWGDIIYMYNSLIRYEATDRVESATECYRSLKQLYYRENKVGNIKVFEEVYRDPYRRCLDWFEKLDPKDTHYAYMKKAVKECFNSTQPYVWPDRNEPLLNNKNSNITTRDTYLKFMQHCRYIQVKQRYAKRMKTYKDSHFFDHLIF